MGTNVKFDACLPGGSFWSTMITPILGLKTRSNMCKINIKHLQSGKKSAFLMKMTSFYNVKISFEFLPGWSLILNCSDGSALISIFSQFLITNQKYFFTKRSKRLQIKKPNTSCDKNYSPKNFGVWYYLGVDQKDPPLVLKGLRW